MSHCCARPQLASFAASHEEVIHETANAHSRDGRVVFGCHRQRRSVPAILQCLPGRLQCGRPGVVESATAAAAHLFARKPRFTEPAAPSATNLRTDAPISLTGTDCELSQGAMCPLLPSQEKRSSSSLPDTINACDSLKGSLPTLAPVSKIFHKPLRAEPGLTQGYNTICQGRRAAHPFR